MPDPKKIVLEVDTVGDGCKAKAMNTVAKFRGVKSVAVDGEKGTLTVVGEVDVVCVTKALRKAHLEARVLSVGPEKEEPPPKKPGDGEAGKKPAAGDEGKKPPPCCACACSPPPPHAPPFPGAVSVPAGCVIV